jgi:hypothetical protein
MHFVLQTEMELVSLNHHFLALSAVKLVDLSVCKLVFTGRAFSGIRPHGV